MNILLDIGSMVGYLELIVGLGGAATVIFALWKFMIRPVRVIFRKIETLEGSMDATMKCVNDEILPVIKSLSHEFTTNSGKSIMDRILRIDDNTRLAELRSKLIASNLITTSMVEFDREGHLTWANKAFLNLSGLDMEQSKDNGWFVIIDGDVRSKMWTLWRHSIENGIPFESEFIIKNQNTDVEKQVKCVVYPHKSLDANNQSVALAYYGNISEVVI